MRALLLVTVLLGCSNCGVDEDEADVESGECIDGKCDGPADAHCRSANTVRASLPLYPDRAGSLRFSYVFKRFASTNPNATTVIVINGGPGATLLDATPPGLGGIATPQFHVVYTDHRGSGCNQLASGPFPKDALSTDYLAQDVISIVRRLGLRNYIIFGTSYGTILTARVAHLAKRLGLPQPKALVLEGAMGKSPNGFDDYLAAYDREWQLVRAQLPAAINTRLSAEPLPLGYSAEVWGTYLQGLLIFGGAPGVTHPIVTALAPLATNDPTGLATLRAGLDATRTALGNGSLFPQVGEVLFCSELFGGARGSALRGGRIVASGIDRCANSGLTFKPFDSASYPLAPPVFYFQGTNDPAVPVASARYHYDRQTSTSRALVTVPAAGHGPLTISLASCAPAFWSAIDRLDATAFATTASACGASLEGKLPGQ